MTDEATTTRQEWRVTGNPGRPFPPYDFTFGTKERLALGLDDDPEAAARAFIVPIVERGGWDDGPHLSSRTITETPWTLADPLTPETP